MATVRQGMARSLEEASTRRATTKARNSLTYLPTRRTRPTKEPPTHKVAKNIRISRTQAAVDKARASIPIIRTGPSRTMKEINKTIKGMATTEQSTTVAAASLHLTEAPPTTTAATRVATKNRITKRSQVTVTKR